MTTTSLDHSVSSPLLRSGHAGQMVEGVPLAEIAARFGTPIFVYSRAAITSAYQDFAAAFRNHDHLICYAVKANSNLGVLSLMAELGAGFDIVSGGELARVLAAGGDPNKIVFSGVGKQAHEIEAALTADIRCFNIESPSELTIINEVASALGATARVSVRVNPDVDAGTHPYIATGLSENKFGVDDETARSIYRDAAALPGILITGVDFHIGSQITELSPFADALARVLQLVDDLEADGITLEHIDVGGGLGITYQDEAPVDLEAYAACLLQTLGRRSQQLVFEPGRLLVGNAGLLLTRTLTLKSNGGKHFAVVDAAMNDLIRPALYQSWQDIIAVNPDPHTEALTCDVVGPVCESGDFLGKARTLKVREGDLLAVGSAGAYSFAMSSNYNSRNRAAEVIVDGTTVHLVRQRESIRDQIRLESPLPRSLQ